MLSKLEEMEERDHTIRIALPQQVYLAKHVLHCLMDNAQSARAHMSRSWLSNRSGRNAMHLTSPLLFYFDLSFDHVQPKLPPIPAQCVEKSIRHMSPELLNFLA